MAEDQRTQIWLVNGETVTVDGDPEQVIAELDAAHRGLARLTSRGSDVYVSLAHVTHLRDVPEPFVSVG